ncbi:rho guanine nucleotide exchange factor 11-like isoform X1 [Dermacentor variabilis]|uniref:rho guanine nucleotide exchange factor 11-like isoform X1 n=1 Tax=Dermacentor variabilis TaxID=34621 RepID=UPI003F5C035F
MAPVTMDRLRCHTRSTHRHNSGTRTRAKNKSIAGRPVRTDAVRLGSFSKGDVLPKREELPHTADGYDTQGVLLVQRCLIVRRDEKGYGLTVSGDNPVFVQSVKPGGAAARAGVHQGDRIIKVNGTLVTQSNHQDVVHLIKSGAHVALTLLGPPPSGGVSGGAGGGERPNNNTGGGTTSTAPAASPPSHQPLASKQSSERITGPQPVDPEKQQQCTNISYLTIKKMLEKEQAYLAQLLQDYGKTSSEKSHTEMQSARKRISHLENQLLALKGSNSGQEATGASSRLRPGIEARRSTEGPEGLRSSSFHVAPHPTTGRPRSGPLASSASLENLSHALGPSPWSVPTHLRQRSSPETLLCTLEGTLGPVEEPPVGPSLDLGLVPSSCPDNPPVTPVRDPGDLTEAWHGDDTTEEADNTSEEGFLEGEFPGLDDSLEGRPLQYGTPPEGPPASGRVPLQQSSILSMDDEERTSDNELTQLGDNGPFNNIWKLLRHPAHLAVFLHYLLSSQMKPSSLLFLIITNLYKLGTGKEMKKWAYEITSTFLVQNAPLGIENIDETILKEIGEEPEWPMVHLADKVLQTSQEQQGQEEEELKDIFLKAREKAMEQLKRLLVDFRNTRTIGLSGLYMPNDVTLDDSLRDKNAELHIVESLLLTELETLGKEDPENLSDYKSALASALATVLKSFGVKTPNAVTLIERFPTFVAREKSRLKFFPRNKKFAFQTINTRGHHFQSQQYHCVTYCNHCQHIIWGVGDQGYQCTNCEMNIHKTCVRVVEEQCIGSLRHKKAKKNHRMSGLNLMEGIKTKARRPNARRGTQHSVEDWTGSLDPAVLPLDPDRSRPETGDECEATVAGGAAELLDRGAARKNSATAVGRSESFRQRRETRPSYRKRSDPNIPRSKSDVDVDDKPTNLNNSGSSSNSSLSTSRSLESPSQSWEAVHRGEVPPLGPLDDSDLEWDLEPPDWQAALGRETLRQLKPKEKKRQDVLNELFHTERSHVRTLKVLERIFRRPLQQQELLAPELLQRLFPNLDELLRIHQGFSTLMKRRRAQEPLIGDIGPMMLAMLDGESGERLQQAVATFCQHQSLALEALKARQKKDQKLAQFLVDAEMHPLCRRLQLKDLVAAGFQRLTKYPLLIENVAKHSALGSPEHAQLQHALQCSKRILAHVNQAVREAENTHRLAELQRRLDKSALDKVENHPLSPVYRHLDLKRHRLVHEGALTMRLPRQKPLDVQLVLLEDLLLVLQRQDGSERLALRFYSVSLPTATAEDRMLQCPVMRLQHLHARDVATDPRAFFLLDTEPEQRAMWEFAAASAVEKRGWLEHIAAATRAHVPPGDDEGKHAPETPSEDTPTVLDTGVADHEDEEEEVPTDKEEGGSREEEETTPPASVAEQTERSDKEEPAKEEGHDKEQGVLAGAPVATPTVAQGGLSLVDFQEVVVVPSAPCETATPVLTPIEQLRRQDQQVLSALAEKQALLAEILRIPSEDYVHMAEISEEMNAEKGLMELLLQVTYHANQLPALINEAMNVTEEDAVAAASSPEGAARRPGVCPHRLLSSVQPLLRYLSLLAPSLAELEQERQRLRLELSRLQDARQPLPCTEDDDRGVNDDMAAECCREAAVQTLEEAVCHCPTTDLDAEDELPHDEPQPAQAQPVYF